MPKTKTQPNTQEVSTNKVETSNAVTISDLNFLVVEKSKILESSDLNLSAPRYRVTTDYTNAKWPMVELGEVCDISSGNSAPQEDKFFIDGISNFFRTSDVGALHISTNLNSSRDKLNKEGVVGLKLFPKNTILIPKSGASTFLNHRAMTSSEGYISSHLAAINCKNDKVLPLFLFNILRNIDAKDLTSDQSYPSLKISSIEKILIPLPPLSVQEEIVKEIEQYQKIIDGANQVIENWKPKIDIDSEWPRVKLGEVCETGSGGTPSKENKNYWDGDILWYSSGELNDQFTTESKEKVTEEGVKNSNAKIFPKGSLLIGMYDTAAFKMSILRTDACFNQAIFAVKPNSLIDIKYLHLFFLTNKEGYLSQRSGARQKNLSKGFIDDIIISLPHIEIQQQIVFEIEKERELVEGNEKLVEVYENKVKNVIQKIWN